MTFNTDIQKTEAEIKVLQAKLELLKEIETHNSQPKMNLENEGEFSIVSCNGYVYYRLKYPTDVIWYSKSMIGRLEPIKDIKTKNELESQWLMNDVKYQNDEKPYCPDEPPEYDEVEWDEKDNPKPTSSDFRQKLFDGIESIFYGTEYQKTLWRVKVDMAVDEVLTHFYDILPEPEEYIGDYGPSQEYVNGWNHYDEIIKEKLN